MRWVSLNREVDSAREQYESVERKLFQAAILAKVESSGGEGELFIVDAAHKPQKPTARGPMRTRALTFALFMVAAALVAFVLTLLDDRIYGEYELKSLKLAPIVHSVPQCGTVKEVSARV
jgi:capsular polysaccharide biosynthesis protein